MAKFATDHCASVICSNLGFRGPDFNTTSWVPFPPTTTSSSTELFTKSVMSWCVGTDLPDAADSKNIWGSLHESELVWVIDCPKWFLVFISIPNSDKSLPAWFGACKLLTPSAVRASDCPCWILFNKTLNGSVVVGNIPPAPRSTPLLLPSLFRFRCELSDSLACPPILPLPDGNDSTPRWSPPACCARAGMPARFSAISNFLTEARINFCWPLGIFDLLRSSLSSNLIASMDVKPSLKSFSTASAEILFQTAQQPPPHPTESWSQSSSRQLKLPVVAPYRVCHVTNS